LRFLLEEEEEDEEEEEEEGEEEEEEEEEVEEEEAVSGAQTLQTRSSSPPPAGFVEHPVRAPWQSLLQVMHLWPVFPFWHTTHASEGTLRGEEGVCAMVFRLFPPPVAEAAVVG
jgi:hypothetical protein